LSALALCLLLAGCQGERPGSSSGNRELIVGAGADVSVSGAFQARLGVYPLNTNVGETLVRLRPDFQVEPLLAERWEHRGENTWRFVLRRGVRFHDGQEFNARAVEWAIAQHAKGGFGYSFLNENSVKVVDDYTVDFTPTQPNYPLPQQLVHPNYSIFAPGSDPSAKPVGTGPFRWAEYRPNEKIVVERNDAYWGEKALLSRITFRFFPDPTTRVLALQAGEVDLVIDLPREQVGQVNGQSDLTVARSTVGLILSFQINAHGAAPYDLLSNRALRQVIGLSFDRRGLIQQVWGGEGEDTQNMTVPAILGPSAQLVKGFTYDPQQAARMLEADGWRPSPDGVRAKNGRRLELVLLANPETDAGTVEYLQAQLKQAGIDIKWAKLPDIGSYAARLNAGEFDLNLGLSNQNDANPLFLPALIYYSKSGRPFAKWYYAGEQFDRLVEEGLRATDPADVQRLSAEAIRVAIDEEAVTIPVAGLYRLYALKKSVRGFVPHPSQTNQSWTQVSVE
jgi:peptide/nickel transport system substrate-binding protein